MHDEGESPRAAAAPDPAPSSSGLLAEVGQLARAVKRLFGAQMQLLAAGLGLARSAISWLLLGALAATVAGVALGLTLLGLIGVLLAAWFGSWVWALRALALLQLLFLLGALALFRRCMHWMSLPVTRGEWSAMMRETLHKAEAGSTAGQDNGQDTRQEERP
jgi:hypothetical protein